MASRATNLDFSDREILHFVNDVADDDGWAYTEDVADKIRLRGAKFPNISVGIRLGHMTRNLGLFEPHPEERRKWRITTRGLSVMNGHVRKSVLDALEGVTDGGLVEVVAVAARRMNASVQTRQITRRQFAHGDFKYRRK